MTNKEAIKILKDSKITYIAPNGKELAQEALGMAINALTQIESENSNFESEEHEFNYNVLLDKVFASAMKCCENVFDKMKDMSKEELQELIRESEERPTAKFEMDGFGNVWCGNCFDKADIHNKYCPNCGAKMIG